MTSVFDGMATALNGVFGADVTLTRLAGGAPETIRAVFRREPVEVAQQDGPDVIVAMPTLRVPVDVAQLVMGDLVQTAIAPGETFRVANGRIAPSPAADGFVVYELESVS